MIKITWSRVILLLIYIYSLITVLINPQIRPYFENKIVNIWYLSFAGASCIIGLILVAIGTAIAVILMEIYERYKLFCDSVCANVERFIDEFEWSESYVMWYNIIHYIWYYIKCVGSFFYKIYLFGYKIYLLLYKNVYVVICNFLCQNLLVILPALIIIYCLRAIYLFFFRKK